MAFVKQSSVNSFSFKIHMAGELSDAIRVCRKFCMMGACVQIWPCRYVYTGGTEDGFVVSIMNYARFPKTKVEIEKMAISLATMLADELCQASFSIEGPDNSDYYQNDAIRK